MKYLALVIAIVLLASSGFAATLAGDSMRNLGGAHDSRAVSEAHDYRYIVYDSGSADGKRAVALYSSNFGASWSWITSQLFVANDISTSTDLTAIDDTVYATSSGGTTGTIASRIAKLYNGAVNMRDTVGTWANTFGYNLSVNIWLDSIMMWHDSSNTANSQRHEVSYGDGRLAAGTVWQTRP